MKKLGIIGAMQVEVETLLGVMKEKKGTEIAGSTFWTGKLSGLDVVVVQCGVGKVNAALCVQILCSCFSVTHILNTGVAGSLLAKLDIGDMVVSTDAMYHDFDCQPMNYAVGQVPGLDVLAFPADTALADQTFRAAEAVNPGHTVMGRIASGDQFISDQGQKDRIIAVTGAVCTEMEGTAIAQAAYRNQVPFVILRAISDKADHSAQMDYPIFEAIAAHRSAQVVIKLAGMIL